MRILDSAHGSDAITRVLIETADGTTSWETVGVAANIVEASWEALVDGVTYGLLRQGVTPADPFPRLSPVCARQPARGRVASGLRCAKGRSVRRARPASGSPAGTPGRRSRP
ncbi:hypothetical protein GCM10025868_40050 [Angustibacter aerolatus]|uniref:2-isopropylmalate synthase LeuA allosteric (dimerisation) domain-containing protein n=1 Tax=Angustibacter aerolatus TaxID=1162965 RepID=A0ABQ6JKH6_9ACTN|nr:hypothetical protein GCM10025868_40050 [Angustibacter aerolatus]